MAKNAFMQFALIITLFGSIAVMASNDQLLGAKVGLEQLPSEKTDFPGDNDKAIKADVTSAKKDTTGYYHVKGVIKNLGNTTLTYVKVVGHFYDNANQTVGVTGCCYTDPTDIEPGYTATFDSFVGEEDMAGKPTSFKLSFDWG